MKRAWWKLAALGVVLVGGGVAYAVLRPDLGAVWARATALLGDEEAGASPTGGELPGAIEAPPGSGVASVLPASETLKVAARLASVGLVDASRPPLPIVALSSPDVARRIGLETAPSLAVRYAPAIRGNAEIAYNANLYGEVRPRVGGIIRDVIADEGSPERRGETMLVIDSATVGTAKADYLAALPVERLAQQSLDMIQALRKDPTAPAATRKDELMAQADLNKAKAAVLNARQRLLNLGFTESDLARMALQQDTSTLLDVVSPLDGIVVERHAVAGEAVEPTDRVFVVADVRSMWAWVDIYETEIERVKVGQPVTFTISGTEEPVFEGKVDWIDAAVNAATRTIRVRVELKNQGDRLRANEFGQARIRVGEERDAVFVPRDAVQPLGDAQVVFVPLGEGRYLPVRVVTAPTDERGLVEVVSGLAAGQDVVTIGAFLLKSELAKSPEAGGD
jgi:cobalt-zinc-cadmium efflux system membrane fusion protein